MDAASFLIKPASSRCNLACRYCFYRDVAEHRAVADYALMSAETADLLVKRALELDVDSLSFGFQGGEPTLAGLPFFEHFVAAVREAARAREAAPSAVGRRRNSLRVDFAIQTNGVAVDAAWARFFKREGFLVGVSIDGPRLLHDAYRVRRDGAGSYAEVLRGIQALRAEGVSVNALCVVDAATADNAATVYRKLRSLGFDWLQFIPCLDPLDEAPGGNAWSLTSEAFERFLKVVFDLRYEEYRAGTAVNVRWFDNLVRMAMGYPPESCGMAGVCTPYFTVESDGSIYPCDFYVTDEYRLGNLRDASFASLRDCETARRFSEESRFVDPDCLSCFAYPLCRGGCRRDREPFAEGRPVKNRWCRAYQGFFGYAGERIMELAKIETEAEKG